uniref:Uncharacterized protein n=1 Tax=Parascaris univalens TaxID=6257 RepID=A0A915A9Q7_PARUN
MLRTLLCNASTTSISAVFSNRLPLPSTRSVFALHSSISPTRLTPHRIEVIKWTGLFFVQHTLIVVDASLHQMQNALSSPSVCLSLSVSDQSNFFFKYMRSPSTLNCNSSGQTTSSEITIV